MILKNTRTVSLPTTYQKVLFFSLSIDRTFVMASILSNEREIVAHID